MRTFPWVQWEQPLAQTHQFVELMFSTHRQPGYRQTALSIHSTCCSWELDVPREAPHGLPEDSLAPGSPSASNKPHQFLKNHKAWY